MGRAYGARDPPPRRRGAPRALPGPGRVPRSTSTGARSSCSRGPNGGGQDHAAAACAPAWCRSRGGEAVVLGHDLRRDRRAVRARVGLLGHGNGLYDDLTVAENVRFWGRAAGATAAEIDAAHRPASASSGRLADTPVGRLSAGQRRRTALAALVARRPELWLLDEPHAGLDAEGRDLPRRPLARGRGGRGHRRDGLPRARPGRGLAHRTGAGRRRAGVEHSGQDPAAVDRPRRPLAPSRRRSRLRGAAVLRTLRLVAGKDLRIEARSRVATNQVLPFAVMVLRAVRLRPRPRPRARCGRATPGLFWVAVLFCLLFAVPALVRGGDRRRRARRAAAVARSTRPGSSSARRRRWPLELLALEVVLGVGDRRPLRRADPGGRARAPRPTALVATCGLAAAGTLYGGLAAGLRVRETLLPLLLLPVVAPVLIGATRAFESALGIGDRAVARGLALGRPAPRVRARVHRPRPGGLRATPGGRMTTRQRDGDGGRPGAGDRAAPVAGRRAPRARGRRGASACWCSSACRSCCCSGLVVSPEDVEMGESVRIMYVHVPSALAGLPGVRRHGAVLDPLPLEAHPQPDLGPVRRRVGRDRRALHRPGARDRHALGPADLGRVLDLGRPPHQHRAAVPAVPRLPGHPPPARRRPRCGPSAPPSPA